MDLAGDIVQDMCRYLKIQHLESVADYPREMEVFEEVLQRVEDHNTTRLKLSAEISHRANIIKNLVIRAEDARILNDVGQMKNKYSELYDLNQELIGEYTKRANNHAELLKSLKEVNHMIQKAAKLRMGQYKKKVVSTCRKAIKSNNIHTLLKIIKVGHPGPGKL
jgi:Bardet-Biedl syndrome 2 protein